MTEDFKQFKCWCEKPDQPLRGVAELIAKANFSCSFNLARQRIRKIVTGHQKKMDMVFVLELIKALNCSYVELMEALGYAKNI